MKVVTPRQMNEIDSMCINRLGIPGMVLMENAALKVVEEARKSLGTLKGRNIVVLAGKGNNGGDAFAAARHFDNRGSRVSVCLVCGKDDVSGDAGSNLDIIVKMGLDILELAKTPGISDLRGVFGNADMIIDGIFGTGFRGEVTGFVKEVIQAVNEAGKPVISIDIPSGVNGTTGEVGGVCIKADRTVTFGLPKVGVVTNPGCEYAGELVVADIGIPPGIVGSLEIKTSLITGSDVLHLIPPRKINSNKADFGKVFIVTGSRGMTGAGCLSGRAALRAGAGLVYLGVPSSLAAVYDTLITESVTVPLEDKGTGFLSRESSRQILDRLKQSTVAAVGPGLSLSHDIVELVESIIQNADIPLVLDADALNAVAKDVSMLGKLRAGAVITPHPGEMAKLVGISSRDVQNNRIETAREFSVKWKVITVLKGSRTIVAFPDGTTYINPTGNSGMATGGTGDVLTGLIAGLIGQGASPGDAAAAGVYIHGLAGDRAAAEKGEYGLVAGDLAEEIPYAIKQVIGMNDELNKEVHNES